MMTELSVKKNTWIYVGESRMPAYVTHVVSEHEVLAGYYQNKSKVIRDDFVFVGGRWEFKCSGPSGSYISDKRLEALIKNGT